MSKSMKKQKKRAAPKGRRRMARPIDDDDDDDSYGQPAGPNIAGPTMILRFSNDLRVASRIPRPLRNRTGTGGEQLERISLQLLILGGAGAAGQGPALYFFCDSCNAKIAAGATRYHCLDCRDLDLCAGCFQRQAEPAPHRTTHRMQTFVNGVATAAAAAAVPSDPLVQELFGGGPAAAGGPGVQPAPPRPQADETVRCAEADVRRFLLALLVWGRSLMGLREFTSTVAPAGILAMPKAQLCVAGRQAVDWVRSAAAKAQPMGGTTSASRNPVHAAWM